MEIRRRGTSPREGQGVERWTLAYLDVAAKEGAKILDRTQYAHIVQQVELLAREAIPGRATFADVRPIEEFLELREKGGVLGKTNLRVYFAVVPERDMLLVLGCYKKEDEGQLPVHIKVRIKNRLRYSLSVLGVER